MPVLTRGTTPEIYDLADRLSADLRSGRPSRQSFGAKDAAFGWAGGNLPSVVGTYISGAVSETTSFNAVIVGNSATKAAKVAAGAVKPTAVALTASTVGLPKYAGLAEWQLERQVSTDGLAFAIYNVIGGQCLLAYDVDVVAALDAATTPMTAAADWASAILGGIGAVSAAGGRPDLVVLSPADFASAVQPGDGYWANPADGVASLYGCRICISAAAPAGTGYVLDSAAATAVELAGGPVAILDPYTKSDTNVIRLVVDFFAGIVINAPGLVAAIAKSA